MAEMKRRQFFKAMLGLFAASAVDPGSLLKLSEQWYPDVRWFMERNIEMLIDSISACEAFNRNYAADFGRECKIGDTVRIRKPAKYEVRNYA